jgi:hypothetical protein
LKASNDKEIKRIKSIISRIERIVLNAEMFKAVPMPIRTIGLIYSSIDSITLHKFVSEMDSYCKGYILLKKLDLLKVDTKETIKA